MNIYHSTKTLPYVYYCEHKITGEFYIGSRWANKQPSSIDFGTTYKTSSKTVKPRFDEFKWHIVAEFFDPDAAYDFEQQLIFENFNNPNILNKNCFFGKGRFRSIHGPNFGKSPSIETRMKQRESMLSRVGYVRNDEIKKKNSISKFGVSHQVVVCPHCGKQGGLNNMKRWHFDNCKLLND